MLLLLLANQPNPVHLSNLLSSKKYQGRSLINIFSEERPDERLVDILAYCLMPNHFHMVIREKSEGGMSTFMGKLMTGYSMYFNKKHERTGTLFQGRFQAKHIDNDSYFRHIFSYVHLNPVDLFKSSWKDDKSIDKTNAVKFLDQYEYSSYPDYFVGIRPESSIILQDFNSSWGEDIRTPEELFNFYTEEGIE